MFAPQITNCSSFHLSAITHQHMAGAHAPFFVTYVHTRGIPIPFTHEGHLCLTRHPTLRITTKPQRKLVRHSLFLPTHSQFSPIDQNQLFCDADIVMSLTNIYQQIYDADISSSSGVPAVVPGESTSGSVGYVLVTEAEHASTVQDVIAQVQIPSSKQRSYQLAEALFDNYDLNSSIVDDITEEEAAEVDQLLHHVVSSAPMVLARKYIESGSGRVTTDESWFARVKDTWFRPFRSGSSPTRSGFEHVFMGEAKQGKVGGLHWWYFYVNKMKDIEYQGAIYSNIDHGLEIPELVTLSFEWNAGGRRLFKKIGGFFVGLSVEGLMAMGMVRAADDAAAPNVAVLQGAEIELKMFKSEDRRSINTFYPVFRRALTAMEAPSGNGSVTPAPASTPTPAPVTPKPAAVANETVKNAIRLTAVMANPSGDDTGRESVTIMNVSVKSGFLQGWSVVGPNGSALKFGDVSLEAGEARTFAVPARGSLQLSNKGGEVKLVDSSGDVVQSAVYSSEAAKVQGGVLLWNGTDKLVLAA